MTKAADKFSAVSDKMRMGLKTRFVRHNEKIKAISQKQIEQDADGWVKAARVTEKVVGIGGRVVADTVDVGAALVLVLLKIFVKMSDWVLLDNNALDFMQNKFSEHDVKKDKSGKYKKISKFTKENPRVAAYLTWYLMLVSAIGGIGVAKNKDKIADAVKDKIENVKGRFAKHEIHEEWHEQIKEEKTINLAKIYNPEDALFKKNFINENWDNVVVGLLEFETYRQTPKLQKGESRYTYGPGLTWVYENNKQNPCNVEYKNKAMNFSDAEIWNQVKQHCLHPGECMSKIRDNLTACGFTTITDNQGLALLYAGYQIPRDVKIIIQRLQAAGNDTQKIVDSFIAGEEVKEKWRKGTNKRRWWCAMYYVGKITADDFLAMDRDAFSEVDINVVMQDGHFVYDDSVIEYATNLRNTKNPNIGTVQDFIESHDLFANNENISNMQQVDKKVAFDLGTEKMKEKYGQINFTPNYSNSGHES